MGSVTGRRYSPAPKVASQRSVCGVQEAECEEDQQRSGTRVGGRAGEDAAEVLADAGDEKGGCDRAREDDPLEAARKEDGGGGDRKQ
jgi:hypothetical protein